MIPIPLAYSIYLSIAVSWRPFGAEDFPRGRLELEGMRILGGVGTDLAENRKIS